jgi:hypothetical protein
MNSKLRIKKRASKELKLVFFYQNMVSFAFGSKLPLSGYLMLSFNFSTRFGSNLGNCSSLFSFHFLTVSEISSASPPSRKKIKYLEKFLKGK